jgi:hypothetical protein
MGAASEAILSELCQRSFLSLWSYPNPYNDKGLLKRKEGKELCDLLVIFGNDVIIFSDKSCAYPETGDEQLDWKRWYKRAVEESIDQIAGAERWLKEHPARVFADNRCTVRLDVRIPQAADMRVHRVVVALGARDRCRSHFGGGSGSLPISGGGSSNDPRERRPFYLGNDGGSRGFVHVFDDVGLHVVLRELDTVADFVDYLRKKEACFASTAVVATGEEDLLGHFLTTMIGDEHDFLGPVSVLHNPEFERVLFVDESAYRSLVTLPQYGASKQANRPSYIWDRLIEHFAGYFRKGELQEGVAPQEFEEALRQMASPNRVVRRQLGRMVYAAMQTQFGPGGAAARYSAVTDQSAGGKVAYAVVCMPASSDVPVPYDVYRQRRRQLMELYSRSLRVRVHTIERVLVVGVQPSTDDGSSEDLGLFEVPEWTPELDAKTREQMELFGLGAEARHFREQEFPDVIQKPLGREAERRRRQMERLAKKRGR